MATTKFYVPELGDTITLAEDFTFNLHAESRNQDLAAAFGHYIHHYSSFIDESVLPPMREPDYEVKYPDKNDPQFKDWLGKIDTDKLNKAYKQAEADCLEYKKYWEDRAIHREEAAKIGKPSIQVTLPKGTKLIVDRIYIRKGASDYSSITFRTNSLGEATVKGGFFQSKTKTKKSLRFWIKLQECNTIIFES